MIGAEEAPVDTAAANALNDLVDRTGFRMFHLAFGDGNRDYQKWMKYGERVGEPLRGMVELFLLMRTLDEPRVKALLGEDLFDSLVSLGVLCQVKNGIRTPGLVLISFRSLLFFHELTMRPGIYFGLDSIALAIYQHPSFRGTTLDLCAGSAIQAMISAQHGKRGYAVEINPKAAAIAEFNLKLNHLDDRVTVVNKALEDFAAAVREPFDLITFNPPLLPVPDAIDYPFVGDGGADGLEVTRHALSLYLPHLAPRGSIEFIGCGLGRDGHPSFVDGFDALLASHDAGGHVQLVGYSALQRGDLFYDALVETAAINSKISVDFSHEIFDLHFRQLGMDGIYMFFMRVDKPERPRTAAPRVSVANLSERGNIWFA